MSQKNHPPSPAYSIPGKPPAEALFLKPETGRELDKGLLTLAVVTMGTTAALDNLRAPLLPILTQRAGLNYGGSAGFIAAVSLGALCVMIFSTRLLVIWPQRRYLLCAALLQSAAAWVAASAGSAGALMTAGLLWGAGNAGLGLSANLFAIAAAPESKRGKTISFLHVFYGLFATLPALYLPWAVTRWDFQAALLFPFLLLLLPAIWAYSRPKEVRAKDDTAAHEERFGLDAWLLIAGLSLYVMAEVLVSIWSVSYLVSRGAPLSQAGGALAGFFICLAAGRLCVALWLAPAWERRLPIAAMGAGAFAAILITWGLPSALALFGFLIAPAFPLTAAVLVRDYPGRYKSLMPLMYSVMMTVLALGNQAFGWVSDAFGIAAAFHAPAVLLALAFTLFLLREHRRA